mgnify:CR=1 FL=1
MRDVWESFVQATEGEWGLEQPDRHALAQAAFFYGALAAFDKIRYVQGRVRRGETTSTEGAAIVQAVDDEVHAYFGDVQPAAGSGELQ